MQNKHFILLTLNFEMVTPHGACTVPLGLLKVQKYETKILRFLLVPPITVSGLGKSDFGFSLKLLIHTNIADKFIP